MNPVTSPLTNGDMYPPPPGSYARWGAVGQFAWFLARLLKPGDRYLDSLKRQIDERGSVPPAAWGTQQRQEIADEIISILAAACWQERLSFHPNDPWLIVGKCELSNISDIDAAFRIEKKFGLRIPSDELWDTVKDGLTFAEVVAYVEKHEGQAYPDTEQSS